MYYLHLPITVTIYINHLHDIYIITFTLHYIYMTFTLYLHHIYICITITYLHYKRYGGSHLVIYTEFAIGR